ncbi:HNH endonuclease [Shouchella miscanthi]|uniref:HNH endonuclease n=1 Tax=Shouchella miscanthi TaxID=2598861 RepID=A0ABU6NP94_9BACI|nr:HNH endonuclease [Shouchella miscanthi]
MLKKLNIVVCFFVSFLMIFSLAGYDIARAVEADRVIDAQTAEEMVDEEFYESVEEATFYEEMTDEEYSSYLEFIEEEIYDEETGDYLPHYFEDDTYNEQIEVIIEEGQDELDIIQDEDDEIIVIDDPNQMETFALPFLIPLVAPHVFRLGGQLMVRQYLAKQTRNIVIRNGALAGKRHSVTRVKFNSQGFPQFSSQHTMTLTKANWKSSNTTQFKRANASLKNAYNNSATVRNKFTAKQRQDIVNGKTPRGYVWHHHQNRGRMQLVNANTHQKTGHTGGKAIWGRM